MEKKKKEQGSLGLLLKWAGKCKIWLYISVVLSFISGLCTVLPYFGLYNLIDALSREICTTQVVITNAIIIGVGMILRYTLFGLSGVCSHKGAYSALYKVRCMVSEHMSKVPLGYLSEHSTGDIKSVLNEDIEKLELFLAHNLPELIHYMVGPIAIFIYLCVVNVALAFISLIPLVVAFIAMIGLFATSSKMMPRANRSMVTLNSMIIEYISGMKQIKAYNMGSGSFKKYSDAIKEENDCWNTMSKRMGPFYAIFVVLLECGMLLMVPIGGKFFLGGSIATSVFILFAFVGSMYLTEILPLQQIGMSFAQVLTGIKKAKAILDLPIYQGGSEFPKEHDIEIKDVDFSYDGHTTILENCNLSLKQGERLVVVGASGSGKSTLIQLVSRFYDVQKGIVTIGGKDVKDIEYETLLKNISIVFQKAFLTRDSVLENIRMGSNATLAEVREAAKKAQIDDFIMTLPQGYDTKVGSFGTRFSGGEKQRIAIARAILKNSPILILDEATSAADPENQVEIDKAIANLCEGKTVIIVAHRLGAIKTCDKVAVVENHTVSCVGTHKEVLEHNDYYRKAWRDYESARQITYEGGNV